MKKLKINWIDKLYDMDRVCLCSVKLETALHCLLQANILKNVYTLNPFLKQYSEANILNIWAAKLTSRMKEAILHVVFVLC